MYFICPICNKEVDDEKFYCKNCKKTIEPDIFEEKKVCPTCEIELDIITSCGIDDYYCENCKRILDKKEIKKVYIKL